MIESTGHHPTTEQRMHQALLAISHSLRRHQQQLSALAGEIDTTVVNQFASTVNDVAHVIADQAVTLERLVERLRLDLTACSSEGIRTPPRPSDRTTREAAASLFLVPAATY